MFFLIFIHVLFYLCICWLIINIYLFMYLIAKGTKYFYFGVQYVLCFFVLKFIVRIIYLELSYKFINNLVLFILNKARISNYVSLFEVRVGFSWLATFHFLLLLWCSTWTLSISSCTATPSFIKNMFVLLWELQSN